MPKGILTSAVVYEYHANSFGKQVCLHYAMSEQYIVAEASTQRGAFGHISISGELLQQ